MATQPSVAATVATVNVDGITQAEKSQRRRAALAEIDNAHFNWYHVKTCLITGVGFFVDAYDIFAINMCATMIGVVYTKDGTLSAHQELGLKVATPVGTLVGQLVFGWLADRLGRKKMYGIELLLVMIASVGQAVAGKGPGANIFGVLIAWRALMGVGIGGDYPLSAIITSEFAGTKYRGRMMNAVFAMQGFGNLTAAIVALIATAAFKHAILNSEDMHYIDYCWRIIIGVGAIPAAIALYYRMTIPESPRYTMDVTRDLAKAESDADFVRTGRFDVLEDHVPERIEVARASTGDFKKYFSKWKNLKVLIGCSWSWFVLDIAFYGLGLNSSIILTAIGFGTSTKVGDSKQQRTYDTLINQAVGNIVLSVAGLIPGYWASFFLIDVWGRRPIQLMGFTVLTVLFVVLGFGYNVIIQHSTAAFVVLYCLTNFFQNFGPNSTTFIIPGEVFPTRYRSTSHGIAAASGKLGAIIAQVGFATLKDRGGPNAWLNHIIQIFAFFMLTGIASTVILPETKNRSLEALNGEEDIEDNYAAREYSMDESTGSAKRKWIGSNDRL